MKLSTQSFSVFSRVMKLSTQSFSVFLRVMKLFHPVRWCHFGVEDHSTPIVARSLGVLCVPAVLMSLLCAKLTYEDATSVDTTSTIGEEALFLTLSLIVFRVLKNLSRARIVITTTGK